ncbi:MAG: Mut7-C ubiquitin/RNAse domain-containing protein [Bacteroidales bacterium]|nr:Mut7-C ubiquitin/RNAse domain-containing protein [Bacteroidales bacterium]
MAIALFRFYEELNDFLPSSKKKVSFSYSFTGNPSVKDAIEAIGVPHVEVDLILANGRSVDFSYKLKDEDQISVYPVFESIDIAGFTRLRKKPLRVTRFITDAHLGRLAKNLRLCGFDTFFDQDLADKKIIEISLSEKRIILTRDKGLLKNREVTHGYWIRSINPDEQIREVIKRFDLKRNLNPFTRCLECNGILKIADEKEIASRLPPKTLQFYDEFRICPGCDRIYWNGSHYERMQKRINILISDL